MLTVGLKAGNARSWADHRFAKVLCARLYHRLLERCKGEAAVRIELTYKRDPYDDPYDLYLKARKDRHVRRFIDRLELALGTSLRGRWLCKMEFQTAGWLHYHLLITGLDFIDHTMLEALWGHGYVYISKATRRSLSYMCKYVSKTGFLPPFVYGEPIRSLKVVRASTGFWRNPVRTVSSFPRSFNPLSKSVYRTIGHALTAGENTTVLRHPEGGFRRIHRPLHDVCLYLAAYGVKIVRSACGWVEVQHSALTDLLVNNLCGNKPLSGPRTAEPSGPDALHLIITQNPPKPCLTTDGLVVDINTGELLTWYDLLEPWMVRYFEWVFEQRDIGSALCIAT